MKKLLFILMISGLIAQESPCEDETYLELKKKKLDKMSEREYEYFTRKDKECSSYSPIINKDQINKMVKVSGTTDLLTDEQKKIYNRKKLNIELIKKTSGSAVAMPFGKSAVAGFGAETSRKWKAYKGFDKISELQFFELTGYNKEAKKIIQYRNKQKKIADVGLVLLGIGGAILINTPERPWCGYNPSDPWTNSSECWDERSEAKNKQSEHLGYFMLFSGIGSGLIINSIIKLSGKINYHPYATVDGIAEAYNLKLFIEIKN